MTEPRWRRISRELLWVLWLVCWFGWLVDWHPEGAVGGVTGGLVGTVVGRWFARRASVGPEQDYEALPVDRRAVVDAALAVGELRGPITLRQVERDLAKARLAQGGPTPERLALGWSLSLALFVAALVLAPTRPTWLVVLSVLVLSGMAVLVFVFPRPDALAPEERRRLKAISKAPLDN